MRFASRFEEMGAPANLKGWDARLTSKLPLRDPGRLSPEQARQAAKPIRQPRHQLVTAALVIQQPLHQNQRLAQALSREQVSELPDVLIEDGLDHTKIIGGSITAPLANKSNFSSA